MFFKENGQYRCAVYLRLSRSDGDQQESNSIKNQRALLNDYLGKHPELHKVDEYVDDGYSGTNFERPDFKRMMQDIENRKINCIIVKDLYSQPQILFNFPKPPSPRTCLIRKACIIQVQRKKRLVLEQSGSGDTER